MFQVNRPEIPEVRLVIASKNTSTAFHVVLVIAGARGPRQVIDIETTYHEHALLEKKPQPDHASRYAEQRRHYTAIANARPDVFRPGWEQLLGTELDRSGATT
jgi:hypothetical protein